MQSLFGVLKIPSDDQIRNFLDLIDPKFFYEAYYAVFKAIIEQHFISKFKVLGNKYLVIALDGSQYFSSKKIYCDNCIIKEHRNGDTEYTHSILGASIVSPKLDVIIPLPPEHNIKDDTNKKQDCEQKAIYRWLDSHYSKILKIAGSSDFIFLTDDLHSHDPFIDALVEYNANFILACKEGSHKSLYNFAKENQFNSITYYDKVDGFKEPKLHQISWLSGLPLRDLCESNCVNWFSLKVEGVKKTKIEVKNSDKTSNNKKNIKLYMKI
jgi:hypothetical protein